MNIKSTLLPLAFLTPMITHAGSPALSASNTLAIQSDNSDWYYRVALYGWGQSLDGDMGVLGLSEPIDVDFADLIEDLEIGLMGALEIGKGKWSVLLDLNYADLSNDIRTARSKIEFEQQQLIGNLVINYQALNTESSNLILFGGVRGNWLDASLKFKDDKHEDEQAWVDPILGIRYRQELNPDFYFRAVGDVGGFGAASEFTWQAMAGIGWQFNPCGGLFLGYRALGTDYEKGGFSYDLTAHGPMIGLEYRF